MKFRLVNLFKQYHRVLWKSPKIGHVVHIFVKIKAYEERWTAKVILEGKICPLGLQCDLELRSLCFSFTLSMLLCKSDILHPKLRFILVYYECITLHCLLSSVVFCESCITLNWRVRLLIIPAVNSASFWKFWQITFVVPERTSFIDS